MRAIDAEDLENKKFEIYIYPYYTQVVKMSDVDRAQTVDAVRRGKWIELPYHRFNCSNCKCIEQSVATYCRCCGAKMDL